ncbi:MAG: hypothetical protein QOG87_1060 [Actinomycetota bacterium]|jgi:hypothetical protein
MKTFRLLILTVLAVVSLAACGDDEPSTSSDTTAANGAAGGTEQTELKAELTGGVTEVPAPGDPDGKGSATVTLDAAKGEVCYDITVSDIAAPTAAHIHEGAAGAQGDIVITFDPAKIGGGETCLTGQKVADIERIGANPAGFYVNVHTADFGGGAVRGQLEG